MSNIQIDNPLRIIALAEQMQGYNKAFSMFIENLQNAVKTTMDQLIRLQILVNNKIDEIKAEISDLYNQKSYLSWPDDKEEIWSIDSQIKSLKQDLNVKYEKLKQIENSIKNIDYQYKAQVKKYEEKVSNYLRFYPNAVEALFQIERIMKQYLTFQSNIISTKIEGDYAENHFEKMQVSDSNFKSVNRVPNSTNSEYIDLISYGRLSNYDSLSDQIIANAELDAQQNNCKILQFEVGSNDIMLCESVGYKIFEENGNTYARKDMHNEINLNGGLLESSKSYKM